MNNMRKIITLSVIGFFLTQTSALQAQPHQHGGRAHTHPLPAQGVRHKHGNGAVGIAAGGAAPAKQAGNPRAPATRTAPARGTPQRGGNANAQLQNAYKRKDYKTVYRIASAYANKGDPAAQFVMGQLFLQGQGQRKNPQVAFNWFKKS